MAPMERLFRASCCLIVLVAFARIAPAQNLSIVSASTATAAPGASVTITIQLSNNGSSITAAQLTLAFDPALVSINSTADVTAGNLLTASHNVVSNLTSGQLRVVISADNLAPLAANSGNLLSIVFRVS